MDLAKVVEGHYKNDNNYNYKEFDDGLEAGEVINKRREWFARLVKEYKPKRILEIGCREGVNLRRIHKYLPEAELYGIDIAEKAIKYAKEALPEGHFICGSIYDLDKYYKGMKFDLIFSMGVMMCVPPEKLGYVRNQLMGLTDLIIHYEEHSSGGELLKKINGTPAMWAHDYREIYRGLNPEIVYYSSSPSLYFRLRRLARRALNGEIGGGKKADKKKEHLIIVKK